MSEENKNYIGEFSFIWLIISIILCFLLFFGIYKQFEFQPYTESNKNVNSAENLKKDLNNSESNYPNKMPENTNSALNINVTPLPSPSPTTNNQKLQKKNK